MRLQVLAFPVTLLIRFWQNHHLLDVMQRPVWRVVSGRSREYVKRILAGAELAYSTRHLCILLYSLLSGNLAGAGRGLLGSYQGHSSKQSTCLESTTVACNMACQ